MEQIRSEFEAWISSNGWSTARVSESEYIHERVQLMWTAWQASRAEIEIELPPVCDAHSDDTDKGYDICHYRTQEYLNKQGFKFSIEGADRWAGLRVKERK